MKLLAWGRVAFTESALPPVSPWRPAVSWICSPYAPWVTPGASKARFNALRPFSGSSVICFCSIVSPKVGSDVFTRDAASVTSTVVLSAPGFRAKFTVRLVVTLTVTAWVSVWNPVAFTVAV